MSAPSAAAPAASNGATAPAARQPPRKKAPVSIFAAHKKKPVPKPGGPTKPLQPVRRPTPTLEESTATDAPTGSYSDYAIVISKKELDLRYHVLKFQTKDQVIVDPYDKDQFIRPVRLLRRAAGDKPDVPEPVNAVDAANEAERELMDSRRAERQAEREENQKLIAPTGGPADAAKPAKKQKKKFVSYDNDNFPERQKRQQLRYEEARPWHLEDTPLADDVVKDEKTGAGEPRKRNIWVGTYEAPLTNQHALFLIEPGYFRMVPVEKYYKFYRTGTKTDVMDAEEAMKHMNGKFNMTRQYMDNKLGKAMRREQERQVKREEFEQQRKIQREADGEVKNENDGEYQADKDGLDIEWDDMNDFQDDDEGKLFEGGEDEDAKEIEQRIREEMRQAGLGGTGVKDEDQDPEEEYRRQQMEDRAERKRTKRMRKQLGRREKKNEYLSDSDDDDPYDDDDSDDSLSDDEADDEAKKKKEEADKLGVPAAGDKSGASSKGTNTPSGRAEKDAGRSNKRSGSPGLSDMSGNESSRKKAKGLNGRPAKVRSGLGGSGSGSESDTSRASGRPKIKIKGSPTGTPSLSRAASPGPVAKKEIPTLEAVRQAIPPEGITIKDLVGKFKAQLPPGTTPQFIDLVKQAGQQNKAIPGKIFPKQQ